MHISYIPTDHVDTVWPEIEEYMHGAAKYTYGRFTVDDILSGLKEKPQQLWIAFDDEAKVYGAVVTQISAYPRMNSLVMHFTGGVELPLWKDAMLEVLQRFARDSNCAIIESFGRNGWGKVFKNDGFRERFMFYELPVEKLQ